MKQLTQKLGNGEMVIQEMPAPQPGPGMVLVRNHYSLISAGTEGSTVKAARKSLIGKAKERPQQVKQVLEVLKTQGPVQTYRAVMKKLDAYSPLGYSSAGTVIDVADDVTEFAVGDKVACAGAGYANHAEVVCVPKNLCVKLPAEADLAVACYNTLGAIALQGVRQADLRLGESCAVIGLGLIGQLACLLLKSSGVNVIGIDLSQEAVDMAGRHCADLAVARNAPGIEDRIAQFTDGVGVDCVIIAAATTSLDPVNFAGAICRRKGKVVVLGAVPTGFDRDPYYYKKELELKMSCSYGPGRYDLDYEELGHDYPIDYVRWTEKRNMQAFQRLLYTHAIDISYLTTHRFAFDDACRAYELMLARTEPYKGIVLEYDASARMSEPRSITLAEGHNAPADARPAIAFVGAGSYAQGSLLPNLPEDIRRVSVATNTGTTAKRVAEKFHFEACSTDAESTIADRQVNTVFIATRHDSHARYVLSALKAGKHVYVEKPICLNTDELLQIRDVLSASGRTLMVGFNRRFAPLSLWVKQHMPNGPKSMIYRVNAGAIPKSHWIQMPEIGGGRIIGEACHFIDLMAWMCDSQPVKVMASATETPDALGDVMNIIIEFGDGSSGVLAYCANGSKAMPKEHFEVFGSGVSAVIDDFKQGTVYGHRKSQKKLPVQDKGQKAMIKRYFQALQAGEQLIPEGQLMAVTLSTFAAVKSVKQGGVPVMINMSEVNDRD